MKVHLVRERDPLNEICRKKDSLNLNRKGVFMLEKTFYHDIDNTCFLMRTSAPRGLVAMRNGLRVSTL